MPAHPNGILLRLPPLAILDLDGNDATAILHNLTTNQVKTLDLESEDNPGVGIETFITNVKGKCLGHVLAFRTSTGFRLIGAGPSGDSPSNDDPVRASQSETIAGHADRYTIREDAVPTIMDGRYQGWLMAGVSQPSTAPELSRRSVVVEGVEVSSYVVPWAKSADGQLARLLLIPIEAKVHMDAILDAFAQAGVIADADNVRLINGESAVAIFHALRVAAGFPWYGIDLDDSHLPQEVGRERQTISFTKGCYLGQETVARLDALGQVQKMLMAWSIDLPPDAPLPQPDAKLFAGGEKPVGRLTSIARFDDSLRNLLPPSLVPEGIAGGAAALALGYARRSHFAPGSMATGIVGDVEFNATIVPLATDQGV
ncbi:CAF17-like 4Fe-4S cluster assembly/insertion protein YgfZ [Neorhodopirellula pilleata]|uniref:CAF17-like 4Fe-4S cluster assembly/insertion protein YgfZ n=1 Tax=Neorhodopirellula pilleata TaxID=2714738 RepID=UPI001E2964BA|nr:aminomethyltransferase [Neorhodopirellula pilleata]